MCINDKSTKANSKDMSSTPKREMSSASSIQQKYFPSTIQGKQTEPDSNMQPAIISDVWDADTGSSASHTNPIHPSGTWTMPTIANMHTKQRSDSKNTSNTRLESFKTSRVGMKIGAFAVVNNLVYVPRLPDDAIIGVNADQNHSRDSYIRVHHDAITFARQLPRGVSPGFYNPSTHSLVPLPNHQRHHSLIGLQARPSTENVREPDLLDMEFMPEKAKTMPAWLPSQQDQVSAFIDEEITDISSRLHRPQVGDEMFLPNQTTNSDDEVNQKQILARIPTPLRPMQPALPDMTPTKKPQSDENSAGRSSELFYKSLPVTITLQTCEPTEVVRRKPLPYVSSIVTNNPPKTWAGPSNSNNEENLTSEPTEPRIFPSKTFHGYPPPSASPPITLKDIRTFTPQQTEDKIPESPADLIRSTSQQKRKQSERTRRDTSIYRKKTSKEIWENESSSTPIATPEEQEEVERLRQEKKAVFERQHNEKLRAMQQDTTINIDLERSRTRQQQYRERRDQQRQNTNQPIRPTARTFHAGRDEHRLRTLPGKSDDLRATARTFHLMEEDEERERAGHVLKDSKGLVVVRSRHVSDFQQQQQEQEQKRQRDQQEQLLYEQQQQQLEELRLYEQQQQQQQQFEQQQYELRQYEQQQQQQYTQQQQDFEQRKYEQQQQRYEQRKQYKQQQRYEAYRRHME